MNLDDLKEILEDNSICDFRITTDKRGQIVIHTGLIEDTTGELVSLEDVEDEDYDEEDEEEFGFEDVDEDTDDDEEEDEDD